MPFNKGNQMIHILTHSIQVGGIIPTFHTKAIMFKILNLSNNGHNLTTLNLSNMLQGLHYINNGPLIILLRVSIGHLNNNLLMALKSLLCVTL